MGMASRNECLETVPAPVVHVVDDDDDLRRSLGFLLETVGIEPLVYPDAATFLAEVDLEEPAVVVVDVRMPGMSGFQLQERLHELDYPAPVIFCSAHGDIPMSVRAITHGAVDFLEKPYDHQRMLDVVQAQLAAAGSRFAVRASRRDLRVRLDPLTLREREVLHLLIEGLTSQEMANMLGASAKTIDVHRTRIKAKTDASSLGALVRDILRYGVKV